MELKAGYKQTEVGVIPEDWEVRSLSEVVDFLDGCRRPVKDSDRAKMRGNVPYYGASGIVDYVNSHIFDEDLILLGEDGENILSRNTRLAFKISGKTWVNNHAHVLRPKSGMSLDYLVEFLENQDYAQYNTGTAQPKLNKLVCSRIPVLCPSPIEQRAIAQALSDVDALLATLDQMIAKKRDLKQATMQQLLTGKTRLPGFGGDWDAVEFGAVATIRNEKVLCSSNSEGTPCVELEFIGQANGRLLGYIEATGASSKYSFKEGDVLFGRLRAYLRKHWRATFDGVCSTEIWPLIPRNERLYGGYLHLLVQMNSFVDAACVSYGTHMPRSDWGVLGKFEVQLPSVPEQVAISASLFDMDAELEALENRLEKTRNLKQAMMQELLTGKTRLVQEGRNG
ncbi:restriction endonuclease subunit S [Acinetobacter sp. c3-l95]|uniref:restriction endonuclease subunit S n=1 Tax=Acinetobacter sp. c3-l95 TaxID=3342804 RepID=UPI0035B72A08